MTFRILKNSTTADASDVNDNFFWGAQGTVIPMSGVNLDYTTSVNNIGSDTYKWGTLYCGTITVNTVHSGGEIFEYVERKDVSSPTTTISFTGLNGDDNNEYMIIFGFVKQTASTHSYQLAINDTSGSMVIRGSYVSFAAFPATYGDLRGFISHNISTETLSTFSFGYVKIKSESSGHSVIQIQSSGGNAGIVPFNLIGCGADIANSSTLTSLQLKSYNFDTLSSSNFQSGSYAELWRMPN